MIVYTKSHIGRDWDGVERITIVYQETVTVESYDCCGGLRIDTVHVFERFRVESRWEAFRRWARYLLP